MITHTRTLGLIALLAPLAGCETTIPETDNTAPHLEIKINGPGVDKILTKENADQWQLDLEPGATYTFALTCTDAGGIASVGLQAFSGIVFHDVLMQESIPVTPVPVPSDPHAFQFQFTGDRGNPVDRVFMIGKMDMPSGTPGSGDAGDLLAGGADFGGRSGPGNRTQFRANIMVTSPGRAVEL